MTKGWKQWVKKQIGIRIGCERDCKFCFAKILGSEKGYTSIDTWKNPKDRKTKDKIPSNSIVGFPSTHDITIHNYSDCLETILEILAKGNQLIIVTKPDYHIIEVLISDLKDYKDKIEFRITIGSYDNEVLKKFEPNASDFEERLLVLKTLFMAGFETSVAIEPFTSRDVRGLIERIYHYVTREIWVGIMNHFSKIIKIYPEAEELRPLYTKETVCEIYGELRDAFQHPYYIGKVNLRYKDTFENIIKKSLGKGKCKECNVECDKLVLKNCCICREYGFYLECYDCPSKEGRIGSLEQLLGVVVEVDDQEIDLILTNTTPEEIAAYSNLLKEKKGDPEEECVEPTLGYEDDLGV